MEKIIKKSANYFPVETHLNHTQKLKGLLMIFEKPFFSHRLARLLVPFWLKNDQKTIKIPAMYFPIKTRPKEDGDLKWISFPGKSSIV